MSKKRYVSVGLGSRSRMFTFAIIDDFKECAELVGICDMNQTRLDYANRCYKEKFDVGPFPTYKAEDFDKMVKETKADVVIVTTWDRNHHKYICRAMELGCDVITEKPLTTDEEKCAKIFETQKRTGKDLKVAFNYRYSPRNTKVKELIQAGEIGEVISVHFEWALDTKHGADYFRRWHRDKNNSGGLMVHKSTHHFDLVNWWLDSAPKTVFGMGRLAFYGRENAEERGVTEFYERCHGNEYAKKDPFSMNMEDNGELEEMYLKAEHEDGYIRDQSVFGHNISIEDTMSVLVNYENKATLTYSLNAFCPWEGYRVAFNGTKGRLEIDVVEKSYVSASAYDQNNPDFNMKDVNGSDVEVKESAKITLQKLWQPAVEIKWEEGEGGHGGGDKRLLHDLFVGTDNDPFNTAAEAACGAKSILVGVAANKSFATGNAVKCKELFDWTK